MGFGEGRDATQLDPKGYCLLVGRACLIIRPTMRKQERGYETKTVS
jgi:hypothetical protein